MFKASVFVDYDPLPFFSRRNLISQSLEIDTNNDIAMLSYQTTVVFI